MRLVLRLVITFFYMTDNLMVVTRRTLARNTAKTESMKVIKTNQSFRPVRSEPYAMMMTLTVCLLNNSIGVERITFHHDHKKTVCPVCCEKSLALFRRRRSCCFLFTFIVNQTCVHNNFAASSSIDLTRNAITEHDLFFQGLIGC